MYVCLCNAYRESQVCDAIKNCTDDATVEELYARLGSRPRCGQCVTYVNALIKASRAEQIVHSLPGPESSEAVCGSYPFSSPGSI